MASVSRMTKRYLLDFAFRLSLFLIIATVHVLCPQLLDFTIDQDSGKILRSFLWLSVIISMLAQLCPKSNLTTGCLKQFPHRFDPVPDYDPHELKRIVRFQNRGACKVAAVWLTVNLTLGTLYHAGKIRVETLVLFCSFCFLSDLICVLFFCPFQTFLMKNRCCVNCRIFAWGSWMMAAPLMLVPHWYSQSLFWTSVLVLTVWETRFLRYPERFWFGSNRHLQCSHCKEQLCRYKYPRPNKL